MENDKIINRKLLEKYGKDIAGRAMYRIVQNTRSLTEKRQGSIDHFAGRIYVGSEEGIFELPKYSYIPDGYWILEQLFNTTNPELVNNWSYEPVWVFKDKDGNYQAPILKACIHIIEASRRGPAQIETEAERIAKQRKKDLELISQGSPAGCISDRVAWGEGVSYSGLDAPSLIKG